MTDKATKHLVKRWLFKHERGLFEACSVVAPVLGIAARTAAALVELAETRRRAMIMAKVVRSLHEVHHLNSDDLPLYQWEAVNNTFRTAHKFRLERTRPK